VKTREDIDQIFSVFNSGELDKLNNVVDPGLLQKLKSARSEGYNGEVNEQILLEFVLFIVDQTPENQLEYFCKKAIENSISGDVFLVRHIDDDIILKVFPTLETEHHRCIAINGLSQDEIKIDMLSELKDEHYKTEVIVSLSDAQTKMDMLSALKEEYYKAVVIESLSNDKNKMDMLSELESEKIKAEVIVSLSNDKDKMDMLSELENEYGKSEIIASLLDDKNKMDMLSELKGEGSKFKVIQSLLDEQNKMSMLSKLENEYNKAEIIASLSNDKDKMSMLSELEGEDNKAEVIRSLLDDQDKMDMLSELENEYSKFSVIRSLLDDKNKMNMLSNLEDDYYKAEVIRNLSDDKDKISMLSNLEGENNKFEVIQSLSDDQDKMSMLSELKGEDNKLAVIRSLSNKTESAVLLKLFDYISPESIDRLRKEGIYSVPFILENSRDYMVSVGVTEQDIESKTEILSKLYESNEEIGASLNWKFLDEKYLKMLGQEKFEQIACYPNIQDMFMEISKDHTKVEMLVNVLDNFVAKNGDREWAYFTERIITNIYKASHNRLASNISNIEDIDIDILTTVLSSENIFNIKTVDELRRYYEIKESACNSIMADEKLDRYPQISNMSPLDRKKLAVLEKVYGQNLKDAEEFVRLFGEDIENISLLDRRSIMCQEYIHSLKAVLDIKDEELLNVIYEECKTLEISEVNPIRMLGELKSVYTKEFNAKLFNIENAERIDTDSGVEMYNAGTDFSMIITSVGAYYKSSIENFSQSWNRRSKTSQGFCTSYIRNDMLGTAPIPHLCYGFNEMSEDSLMLSGASDIFSEVDRMTVVADKTEKYLFPESQINLTNHYNEMVFKRTQNGERKQPDYIVVFQQGGVINNIEKAQKAAKDFEPPLSIVVVDKDECAKSEQGKLEMLLAEYTESREPEMLAMIRQKIKNNKVGNKVFLSNNPDLSKRLEEFEEGDIEQANGSQSKEKDSLKHVTEDEYATTYSQVEPEKIQKAAQRLRNIVHDSIRDKKAEGRQEDDGNRQ